MEISLLRPSLLILLPENGQRSPIKRWLYDPHEYRKLAAGLPELLFWMKANPWISLVRLNCHYPVVLRRQDERFAWLFCQLGQAWTKLSVHEFLQMTWIASQISHSYNFPSPLYIFYHLISLNAQQLSSDLRSMVHLSLLSTSHFQGWTGWAKRILTPATHRTSH